MDETKQRAETQQSPSIAPRLEVIQGEGADDTFKVKLATKIGRELDNDVVLVDPKVSRYHAQIALEQGQWILTDLGSANGTELNGAVITAPTPLNSGDQINFGETRLIFRLPSHSDTETPVTSVPTSMASGSLPLPAATPSRTVSAPVRPGSPAKLAWIIGGVILLVCFAAIFVIYVALSRIGREATSAAALSSPVPEDNNDVNNEVLAPAQPIESPHEFVLAYEDDFSDSFGGWDDAFDTHTRKVYGNNRYQIEVNASNLVAWGLANRDVADFEIEVEARQEDGDESNSYGLLFRFQDRNNFYRFDISGDGYFLLSKFINGEWTTLVDWTESEFINTGGADNILRVSAAGPEITVSVNSQPLTSIIDDSLSHGNFGFFAGTFADSFTWVSFDNLKMWTPPGDEITLIPTATRPGVSVAVAPSPTPIPSPPTFTPTPEPQPELIEGGSSSTSPLITPTATASPLPTEEPSVPTSEPTSTPVPLPEYASRDQILARGEERAQGRIVFPVYDPEQGSYDIYIADTADGGNLQLLQPNASQPAFSIDGAEFAYRSWQPDRRGLFARSINDDDLNAWRFDIFFEAARPQFSPVDNSLMYHSRTSGREPATYRVINGIGEVMRRDGAPIQGKSPKWSPDGQQFVYSSCLGGTCGIILSNIDGTAPLQLTDHPSDTNPEISPDGSTVIFMSERAGNWEIYRIDTSGENLMALTTDQASDGLPTWSPDGTKIAFVSNRDGDWSIWDMDPDGTKKRRHFVIDGSVDGFVQHDLANSYGWVEENIDWIP